MQIQAAKGRWEWVRSNHLLWAAPLLVVLAVADFSTTYVCLTGHEGLVERGLVAGYALEHIGLLGIALLDIAAVVLLLGIAAYAKAFCDKRGEYSKGRWAVRLMLYPYVLAAGYAVINNLWWWVR